MSIGPGYRFEILMRDGFTCRYCGRKPPAVELEVDHVVPRARGGGNGPSNLVTACTECNLGKGALPLRSLPMIEDVLGRVLRSAEDIAVEAARQVRLRGGSDDEEWTAFEDALWEAHQAK